MTDRRKGAALLVVAAWTAYVWVTRLVLIARDPAGDPAPVVHAGLAAVSLLGAVVVALVGLSLLRRARRTA